uniref:Translocation protein SEC62 n=1 Tax=Aplanochytrium stocchinoi TaxID=215587 RepID=A0A7S3PBA7_9STRA|mmetsp:Transcript_8356/g.10895  ORF Transcript_8356/g.10895 Transcript_8356/m.10895 type:complete len:368 (+) Transcript_8356:163-1266(+)|eukprot:CAMPEP_0204874162 /NCGR_PEP_ID=MMETSP1348-20121228/42621_1 /ASSEMBLY_ACC=CAM_ASM_000700 /TAXON_ID=215587 /ORGANISM="Aplanochytrium stocchinoi, Strain GSBS06" /LENGTH=367 /DNA_ID=CAMNT_0052029869 /DNA_START=142 /DNA_END=1245 /DNA_ORIENTATION=+
MVEPTLNLKKPEDTKRVARYLYGTVPLREAVQISKRVYYFRGKKLIEFLLNGEKHKDKPVCETEEDAIRVGEALLELNLIHGSVVANKKKRELAPIRSKAFNAEGYYTWIYEGSQFKRNLLLGALIFAFLALTMFPVWPQWSKVAIWYLSVTFLIVLTVFIVVRLIFFILFWLAGYEFWILPNIFMDDLGFYESFVPGYTFEKDPNFFDRDMMVYRFALMGGALAFGYWLYNQPTEFDEIMIVQKQFLKDLYDGNLLSDENHKTQEEIDRIIPDLADLEKLVEEDAMMDKMMEEDEAEAAADAAADERAKTETTADEDENHHEEEDDAVAEAYDGEEDVEIPVDEFEGIQEQEQDEGETDPAADDES